MLRLLHTRAAIFPCCHGNVMKWRNYATWTSSKSRVLEVEFDMYSESLKLVSNKKAILISDVYIINDFWKSVSFVSFISLCLDYYFYFYFNIILFVYIFVSYLFTYCNDWISVNYFWKLSLKKAGCWGNHFFFSFSSNHSFCKFPQFLQVPAISSHKIA